MYIYLPKGDMEGLLVSTRNTLTTLVTLMSYPPVAATGQWDTERLRA
jgi:hypothetical protein